MNQIGNAEEGPDWRENVLDPMPTSHPLYHAQRSLDLTCLSKRLAVMGRVAPMPTSRTAHISNSRQVSEFFGSLGTDLPKHLMIFYFGPYDELPDLACYNGIAGVCSFATDRHCVPPLKRLFKASQAMGAWLALHPENIAIVQCSNGVARSGLALSCFLRFHSVFSDTFESMQWFLDMRSESTPHDRSAVHEQVKRYLRYFDDTCSLGGRVPSRTPIRLHQLVIHSVPNFDGAGGCTPGVSVYKNARLLFDSEQQPVPSGFRFYMDNSYIVFWFDRLLLYQDVTVRVFHVSRGQTTTIFTHCFNTGYVLPGIVRMGPGDLYMPLRQVPPPGAPNRSRFSSRFQVDMMLAEVEGAEYAAHAVRYRDAERAGRNLARGLRSLASSHLQEPSAPSYAPGYERQKPAPMRPQPLAKQRPSLTTFEESSEGEEEFLLPKPLKGNELLKKVADQLNPRDNKGANRFLEAARQQPRIIADLDQDERSSEEEEDYTRAFSDALAQREREQREKRRVSPRRRPILREPEPEERAESPIPGVFAEMSESEEEEGEMLQMPVPERKHSISPMMKGQEAIQKRPSKDYGMPGKGPGYGPGKGPGKGGMEMGREPEEQYRPGMRKEQEPEEQYPGVKAGFGMGRPPRKPEHMPEEEQPERQYGEGMGFGVRPGVRGPKVEPEPEPARRPSFEPEAKPERRPSFEPEAKPERRPGKGMEKGFGRPGKGPEREFGEEEMEGPEEEGYPAPPEAQRPGRRPEMRKPGMAKPEPGKGRYPGYEGPTEMEREPEPEEEPEVPEERRGGMPKWPGEYPEEQPMRKEPGRRPSAAAPRRPSVKAEPGYEPEGEEFPGGPPQKPPMRRPPGMPAPEGEEEIPQEEPEEGMEEEEEPIGKPPGKPRGKKALPGAEAEEEEEEEEEVSLPVPKGKKKPAQVIEEEEEEEPIRIRKPRAPIVEEEEGEERVPVPKKEPEPMVGPTGEPVAPPEPEMEEPKPTSPPKVSPATMQLPSKEEEEAKLRPSPPPPPPPPGPTPPPPLVDDPNRIKAKHGFHWSDIKDKKDLSGTLWADMEGAEDLDVHKFEDLFCVDPRSEKRRFARLEGAPGSPAPSTTPAIIDLRRAQNIGIGMSRFYKRFNNPEIRDKVMQHSGAFSMDDLFALKDIMPTAAEQKMFAEYQGPKEALVPAEQFLLEMSKEPGIGWMTESMLLEKAFESDLKHCTEKIETTTKLLNRLTESKDLKKVLKTTLDLGNLTNYDYGRAVQRSKAHGFRVDSLPNLKDVWAVDRESNLTHYLSMMLNKKNPEALNIHRNFPELKKARGYELKAFLKTVDGLRNQVDVVRQAKGAPSTPTMQAFHRSMQPFVQRADRILADADVAVNDYQKSWTKALGYFGEKEANVKPEEMFGYFEQFMSDLDTATRQISENKVKVAKTPVGLRSSSSLSSLTD